jgi:hypothetical protein
MKEFVRVPDAYRLNLVKDLNAEVLACQHESE